MTSGRPSVVAFFSIKTPSPAPNTECCNHICNPPTRLCQRSTLLNSDETSLWIRTEDNGDAKKDIPQLMMAVDCQISMARASDFAIIGRSEGVEYHTATRTRRAPANTPARDALNKIPAMTIDCRNIFRPSHNRLVKLQKKLPIADFRTSIVDCLQ